MKHIQTKKELNKGLICKDENKDAEKGNRERQRVSITASTGKVSAFKGDGDAVDVGGEMIRFSKNELKDFNEEGCKESAKRKKRIYRIYPTIPCWWLL